MGEYARRHCHLNRWSGIGLESSGTGSGFPGPSNRQVAFSGVSGELGGPVELGGGLGVAAELVQEVAAHVVQ